MGTHPIFESDFDCLTETMQIKILLFAEARDLLETDSITLEADFASSSTITKHELLLLLGAQYPTLGVILPSCNIAHNHTYIDDGEALAISSTDEIALIPPIGGG